MLIHACPLIRIVLVVDNYIHVKDFLDVVWPTKCPYLIDGQRTLQRGPWFVRNTIYIGSCSIAVHRILNRIGSFGCDRRGRDRRDYIYHVLQLIFSGVRFMWKLSDASTLKTNPSLILRKKKKMEFNNMIEKAL